jgi:antitoxin (DNA-binding transcriptional repressor) of toxin-antitoxin stability system
MGNPIFSATARNVAHNFSRYAAMVDAGTEVIITRRGRAPLRLVLAKSVKTAKNRHALVQRALSIRSAKPFTGEFVRGEAYEESDRP